MSDSPEQNVQLQDLQSATQNARREVNTDDIRAKLDRVEEARSVRQDSLQLVVGI